MATSYQTEKLIAGNIVSATKTASADTYYVGMLLGRTDATGVYGAYDDADTDGLQNVRAIVAQDRILGAEGALVVYVSGTEVLGTGLVTDANAVLTVTSAIIESAQDAGIIIK